MLNVANVRKIRHKLRRKNPEKLDFWNEMLIAPAPTPWRAKNRPKCGQRNFRKSQKKTET